jgi:hypothetical protein
MNAIAEKAIIRSVRHDEIVTISASDYSDDVLQSLKRACDDSAETSYENGKLFEFWGCTDDAPYDWRVHLECRVDPRR